ncbi:restriction endonuclease subunit S [Mycoplasma sp. Z355B]|uniref:restriction endonuclease subunit S n=1 Tax=Mycoplasma sp. Z355B TaxID=3401689 RepID=UPI003AAF5E77
MSYITTGNSNTQDSVLNGTYPFFIRSDKPLRSNKYLYDEEAVITIGDGNIGKVFHYINGKFDLHQRCYKISNFTDILGKYFYWYFSSNFYDRVIKMSAKATVDSVRLEMIADMKIYFPSNKKEQSKISTFLDSLDYLIHSQELKLEKLQTIKQSLLDKMFIKNNQHMPNVRFNSYYDYWYYVNIQECSKVFIGLVTTMTTNYSKHGVLLIRNSDIKEGRFEFDENPIHLEWSFAMRNKSRMHMEGDVVTVHTGDVGTSAVVSEKEAKSIGFATIVTRPDKNKLDSSFLSVFLNTETHKKWAVQISTGDGRTNYNLGDYKLLNIPMTNLSEQQKIGQFFSNLDSLIHSQEQKLEKLNNIKQALLEKMFC